MAITINGVAAAAGDAVPSNGLVERALPTGGRAWTWTARIRGDLDTTDEFSIPLPQTPCALELFEAVLVDGDGGGANLKPALGTAPGWTIDELDHVVEASTPASSHRIQSNSAGARITLPALPLGARLWIRPAPNAQLGAAGDTFVRVTLTTSGV